MTVAFSEIGKSDLEVMLELTGMCAQTRTQNQEVEHTAPLKCQPSISMDASTLTTTSWLFSKLHLVSVLSPTVNKTKFNVFKKL